MLLINAIFLLVIFLVILKLVTTNHWTTGKKFLVAMSLSLLWQQGVIILGLLGKIKLSLLSASVVANTPMLVCMTGLIVLNKYMNH